MDPHRNQHQLYVLSARAENSLYYITPLTLVKRNFLGDPWESRTPVCGVRGRRLDHLTNGPHNLYPLADAPDDLLVRLRGLEPRTH